jgi:signal transduction histidine kinase
MHGASPGTFMSTARHPPVAQSAPMDARAAELGGRMEIASAPGRGTVVRAEVPAGEAQQGRGA